MKVAKFVVCSSVVGAVALAAIYAWLNRADPKPKEPYLRMADDLGALHSALLVYAEAHGSVPAVSTGTGSFAAAALRLGLDSEQADALARRPWHYRVAARVAGEPPDELSEGMHLIEAVGPSGEVLGWVTVAGLIHITNGALDRFEGASLGVTR